MVVLPLKENILKAKTKKKKKKKNLNIIFWLGMDTFPKENNFLEKAAGLLISHFSYWRLSCAKYLSLSRH